MGDSANYLLCSVRIFRPPLREISCGNKHILKADSHKSSMLKPPCMYRVHPHYLRRGACAPFVCEIVNRIMEGGGGKTALRISSKVSERMALEQRKGLFRFFGKDQDEEDAPRIAYPSVECFKTGCQAIFSFVFLTSGSVSIRKKSDGTIRLPVSLSVGNVLAYLESIYTAY